MTKTEAGPHETMGGWMERNRAWIDRVLSENLRPDSTVPESIHSAMRYAVMGGGKRIRPLLAVAACEALGADPAPAASAFAALELVHTYSLVHDDLPALDDDSLRRGRDTTHVVFGEAAAILTGDALLTEAFRWLSTPLEGIEPARQLRAVAIVAGAIDSTGMIGGQVLDLESENREAGSGSPERDLELLEAIHMNKTGKLIIASLQLGGLVAKADEAGLDVLRDYGRSVGLAFQIRDDILDVTASSEQLGKTAGKDLEQQKLTYPSLLGMEQARARLSEATATAQRCAGKLEGKGGRLHELAELIARREN